MRSSISGTENFAFGAADAGRALADVDQAILVAVGQRLEEHAANHAEDRGVRPDAERQGQDDGDGQTLALSNERNAKRKSDTKRIGPRRSFYL